MSTAREARRQEALARVRAAGLCEYFALCTNKAVGTTSHPVLGAVPTCQRCADRFGLVIT